MDDNKQLHNAARQVLVNGGLTREFIREEAREFIEDAVGRAVNRLLADGEIERLVAREIEKQYNLQQRGAWGGHNFTERISTAIREEATAWVKAHVTFSIKE